MVADPAQELFQAICARDVPRALELASDPAVCVDVRTGVSPLQAAAARGLGEVVEALLARKASLTYASGATGWVNGGRALHYAIRYFRWERAPDEAPSEGVHASLEVITSLLDAGAKLEAKTRRPTLTPLLLACKKGHADVAALLLERGAKVDSSCPEDAHRTALAYAAERDLGGLVAQLVRAGAAPDRVLEWGQEQRSTALILAASAGAAVAVEALLGAGAEVDWRDHCGATALYYAVVAGSPAVVRILLARGADPQARLAFVATSPRSVAFDPGAYIRGARRPGLASHEPADEALRAELRALLA